MSFKKRVNDQILLLNQGKPLEAIDRFFSDEIQMYDNDVLFADGKEESRKKQEPFISSAKNVNGHIVDLIVDNEKEIAIFRNKSSFTNAEDKEFKIDGLCWQQWESGYVIVERYYSGTNMIEKLKEFYKK